MKKYILIVLIFIIFVGLRIVHLEADPPINLSGSAGYFVDEGGWVFNARNKVLFGSWEIDRYNKMYLAPLMNILYYISFSLFGPGYLQARIISIIFSLLIFLFLYLTLKNAFDRKTALISLFLLSVNYLFIVYNRITHPRMGMMFFMALSLYLFYLAASKHDLFYIPLGSSLFLGFICQANMVYFIAASGLTLLLTLRSSKVFKAGLYILAGTCLIALPWYFINYRPHLEDINLFSAIIRQRQFPASIQNALRNILREPARRYFTHYMPFIWFSALVSLLLIIGRIIVKIKKTSPIEIFAAAWLICGLGFLAIMNDPALRWYASLIPPLTILTGLILARLARIKSWLLAVCGIVVILSTIYNVKLYWKWMSHPQYRVKQLSEYLGKTFPQTVICGLWSAELCLGNQHKAYLSWRGLINDDPEFLKQVGATHVFAVKYNREDQYYKQHFPTDMEEAKLIGKYHLWRTDANLYELEKDHKP